MNRLDRQSFLGKCADNVLREASVAVVGLGGGGSHVVQQLAHVGVGRFVLADPDRIDITNTNRLVGGTLRDVTDNRAKVDIARRTIKRLNPTAEIVCIRDSWSANPNRLKMCDLIVGAVDSYREREELEKYSRRYLIPYIDIGMDVHDVGNSHYLISGQVILSTPGNPCLRCCRYLKDDLLKGEANRYGKAGSRPQVIWPNGVLASTAVGLTIQLLTPWYPTPPAFVYLEYDGNKGTVSVSGLTSFLEDTPCEHYPANETGDAFFDIREYDGQRKQDSVHWLRAAVNRLIRRCFLKRLP